MFSGRAYPYYLTFVVYHSGKGDPIIQDFLYTEVQQATEWLAGQFLDGKECRALCDGREVPGLPVHKDFIDQVVKNARSRAEFDRGNL
jgi:hypothetical protein